MTILETIDDNLSRVLAAHHVDVSAPRERILQLNSVLVGPEHTKPRTNLLLCRNAPLSDWSVFVDEDLRYVGDDPQRRSMFGRGRRDRWLQLQPAVPITGDINRAILRSLELLDSPMQSLVAPVLQKHSTHAEEGLDPILAQTGRLLGLADLEARSVEPFHAQAEAVAQIAATVTRTVAPCCPLILGESGCGKNAVAVLAAVGLLRRGVVGRVLEISGAAVSSGAIFRQQRDDRLRQVLEATQNMPDTLLLFKEFDLAIGVSATAASLISFWLDRGVKLIGVARAEFSITQLEPYWTLRRRLEVVSLEEPDPAEVKVILAKRLTDHPLSATVEVAPEVISAVLRLSARREGVNPGAAIGLLEAALSQAAWTGSALAGPDDLYYLISQNDD